MTYQALSSALLAKVKTCNLIEPTNIFDYEPFNPSGFSGYPAAVLVPSQERAAFADNIRTLDSFFFDLRVHQEIPEQGAANTESLLRQLVDNLMASFNTDQTLGANLTGLGYMKPIQVRWQTIRSPQIMERQVTITIEIVTVQ